MPEKGLRTTVLSAWVSLYKQAAKQRDSNMWASDMNVRLPYKVWINTHFWAHLLWKIGQADWSR